MDPLVTSALISAGSSLLGGVVGGGEKRPRYRDALNAQMWATRNDFNTRMEMADKHKISKLVALGVPAVQGPSGYIPGGSDKGSMIAQAGQDLSRAYHAYSTIGERELAKKQAVLQTDNMSLQNDLLRQQIRAVAAAGSPPAYGQGALPGQSGVQLVPKEVVVNTGAREKGLSASDQLIQWNPDGDMVRIPSQAASGGVFDEGLANWAYVGSRTVPDIIHANTKYAGRRLSKYFRDNRKSTSKDFY